MKKARKLITFILAAVMIMSMSLNVWAAGETGTITISDANEGVSYSAYCILDLESFSGDAHSYKVNTKWSGFVNSTGIKDVYLEIKDDYVSWIGSTDNSRAAEFAKLALAYAKANDINPDQNVVATDNGDAILGEIVEVTFDNLPLGYYLVDSSQGVLCSLDTTNKEVTIEEKNEVPSVVKNVKNAESAWDTSNTASIGDTVEFQITITAQPGAQNYVLHDNMSGGLTFNDTSLEVKVNTTPLTKNTDYVLRTNITDGCAFEISFTEDYLKTITTQTSILVTYTATLNKDAIIGEAGNDNEATLEYGEYPDEDGDGEPDTPDPNDPQPDDPVKPSTPPSETTTYTYSFDLVKTDNNNKVLNGATFELYQDAIADENKIKLVPGAEEGVYRVATSEQTAQSSTVITAGYVKIEGLGDGDYLLKETNPPQGYNPLSEAKTIKIDGANIDATVNEEGENLTYASGGIQVINNTGSELPSTGGIGTTIFYIVGGVLVVFAVVLLVTKKRMKNEE